MKPPKPEHRAQGTSCCSPGQSAAVAAAPPRKAQDCSETLRDLVMREMVHIPGGFYQLGARRPTTIGDHESPQRRVKLGSFKMSGTAVTNQQFSRFVEETGYVTTAEQEGWSYVFYLLLDDPERYPNAPEKTPWWRQTHGACWKQPAGNGSTLTGLEDYPVVHVSWDDAQAFAAHLKVELPTESQWECAARGGLKGKKFPWGNTFEPNGQYYCNTWQGDFPRTNTCSDGYLGTAPVASFPPNGYGLFNMSGNVWEWCADWFGAPESGHRIPELNPRGPSDGPGRVVKGGSFLCHDSYCNRYHVHSRTFNPTDTSASNLGFRVSQRLDRQG